MSILSLHRPHHDPAGHSAVARVALPLAGVVAGTAAGFAIATVAHRSRPSGRGSLELAPDGSALEFHEGGVRIARAGESDREGMAEEAAVVAAEGPSGLGAAGIRPTFEIEAELAREVGDAGGDVDAGQARDAATPEGGREPVLSAPRA
jgi:hypothetical protein